MFGLQAISSANGWIISASGISIVFFGLVILCGLVASLHKLLYLWDKRASCLQMAKSALLSTEDREAMISKATGSETATSEEWVLELLPEWLETYGQFRLLTGRLSENFSLPCLIDRAEGLGVQKPCSSLDALLKLGIIEEGEGEFRGLYHWRKDVEDKILPIHRVPAPQGKGVHA